ESVGCIQRIDDAVVPQACGRVVGVALVLVLRADRRLEFLFVLGGPSTALGFDVVASYRGQHARGLLAPPSRDASLGTHPHETRPECASAHAIVAGAEAAANDHREL